MEKEFFRQKYIILYFLFLLLFISCEDENLQSKSNFRREKSEFGEDTINELVKNDSVFINKKSNYLNDLALVEIKNGNFKKAKKIFLESLKIEKNNPIIYNNLGLIEYNEGNHSGAINYYQKAIYYDSSYFSAYINLSSVYIENDYYNRAINICNYVIKSCNDSTFLLYANYFNAFANLKLNNCEEANKFIVKSKIYSNKKSELFNNIILIENEIISCLNKKI